MCGGILGLCWAWLQKAGALADAVGQALCANPLLAARLALPQGRAPRRTCAGVQASSAAAHAASPSHSGLARSASSKPSSPPPPPPPPPPPASSCEVRSAARRPTSVASSSRCQHASQSELLWRGMGRSGAGGVWWGFERRRLGAGGNAKGTRQARPEGSRAAPCAGRGAGPVAPAAGRAAPPVALPELRRRRRQGLQRGDEALGVLGALCALLQHLRLVAAGGQQGGPLLSRPRACAPRPAPPRPARRRLAPGPHRAWAQLAPLACGTPLSAPRRAGPAQGATHGGDDLFGPTRPLAVPAEPERLLRSERPQLPLRAPPDLVARARAVAGLPLGRPGLPLDCPGQRAARVGARVVCVQGGRGGEGGQLREGHYVAALGARVLQGSVDRWDGAGRGRALQTATRAQQERPESGRPAGHEHQQTRTAHDPE
jgi:hypothetical protein